MYSALYTGPDVEARVDDLYKTMFDLIGFNDLDNIIVVGPIPLKLPLGISATNEANPDIVVESTNNQVLLLIQEDKKSTHPQAFPPEGQLVAEFIAAYNKNLKSGKTLGEFYGLTAIGTYPTFYHIILTERILDRLKTGERANDDETVVEVRRFKFHDVGYASFMTDNTANMRRVFECLEILRIYCAQKLDELEHGVYG
jgi:hypothetical protein